MGGGDDNSIVPAGLRAGNTRRDAQGRRRPGKLPDGRMRRSDVFFFCPDIFLRLRTGFVRFDLHVVDGRMGPDTEKCPLMPCGPISRRIIYIRPNPGYHYGGGDDQRRSETAAAHRHGFPDRHCRILAAHDRVCLGDRPSQGTHAFPQTVFIA